MDGLLLANKQVNETAIKNATKYIEENETDFEKMMLMAVSEVIVCSYMQKR